MGETTGGGANTTNAGSLSLGMGFAANIPNGYVVSAATGTNWEGVGVKPGVAVPAGEALGKAWSLAAGRLMSGASDPHTRALLDALSLAKLGSAPRLASAQLVGRYGSNGAGPSFAITVKGGRLYYEQRFPIKSDIPLVSAGGDRYRLDGLPDSISMTFFLKDGKVALLPVFPNIIVGTALLEKQ